MVSFLATPGVLLFCLAAELVSARPGATASSETACVSSQQCEPTHSERVDTKEGKLLVLLVVQHRPCATVLTTNAAVAVIGLRAPSQ